MNTEIFAVVWIDLMLGPLSLPRASARDAIETADRLRRRGAGKITDVQAVHLPAGSNVVTYLDDERC